MANSINPININTQAINYAKLYQADKKDESVKDGQVTKDGKAAVGKKEIAAGDVLSYMAAQSIDVQPKTTKAVDVSKYVTPDQAKRIAGFVQSFESEVEKGLQNFDKEFPQSQLTDQAKLNVAVGMFNQENL